MMVIVVYLGLAGFFGLVTRWGASHARHPIFLLGVVILISGGLSAVLVNDAICVALTPLVVATAAALEVDPVPYLIAVAMAANVGSVATPTGNPQNMLIASTSGAGYLEFAAALTPIAAMGLAATFVLILAFHPRQFLTRRGLARQTRQDRKLVHGSLVLKSLLTAAGVIGALMAGAAPPLAALAGERSTAANRPRPPGQGVAPDRLAASRDVRWAVRGGRRVRAERPHPGDPGLCARPSAGEPRALGGYDGRAFQPGQQCFGGAGAPPLHREAARGPARLDASCNGVHLGGQT